jgi:hypothetical protein
MQASLTRAKRSGHAREPRLEDGCTVHFLLMRKTAIVTLSLVAILSIAGVASADRMPTSKERTQIAAAVQLPTRCARVRVSTVTKKPKWGSVSWRNGGSECMALASNGVTVEKRSHGSWRFVTAGSSFSCAELYAKVPQVVAQDLKISCTSATYFAGSDAA